MVWTCDGEDQPFRFFHEDGTPLAFSQGSSYFAIVHADSVITWEAAEPAVEETVAASEN